MVTTKSSNLYTDYAIKSFFKNTDFSENDEFLLIDNENNNLDNFSIYKKIKIIKNKNILSFSENVNQVIKIAKKDNKNLVFLNNDIIFTKNWFEALKKNSDSVSIPVNNQLFFYKTNCGNLVLKPTMNFKDFNEKYSLLDEIVEQHKKKFKPNQKFQAPLMPFFCFKLPNNIMNDVGYFDENFVVGAEDVDYRIRCAKKGYEVNFLLDSFVLHFHGKSTWDGGETPEETRQRDKNYTEAFNKKWGKNLTELFIERKNFSANLKDDQERELFKKGKFGELIRKIL